MLATTTGKGIKPINDTLGVVKEEPASEGDNMMTTNGDAIAGPVTETEDQLYQFKPYSQDDDCDLNPEFAVICSFISHFSDKLDLRLNIEELKSSIEDQTCLHEGLIDLHVKLLKKVRRYFVRDQWEKVLIRFTSEYSYEDAYELEVLGYQKTRPSIKLQLLRRLMEAQFECDQKFKASVNLIEANELRVFPIGRDVNGNTYWQRTDQDGNLRIFREQPLDFRSWKAVCTSSQDLDKLIDELETNKDLKVKGEPITEPYNPLPELFPEFFIKEEKLEEAEITDGKSTKPRKGRAKAKNQKANSLPVVKEAKEEELEEDVSVSEKRGSIERLINGKDQSISRNIVTTPASTHCGISVESQVRTTLENLVSMVVSSFEYIIRPLSRNSSPQNKEQSKEVKTKKQAKKRTAKRDKPREETLPRRTSSRIQQLQMRKIAEQEEEMKKILESNASKNCGSIASFDDDSRSRSSSTRNNKRRSESPEDDYKNGKRRRNKRQSWKRGKGKKKLSWDKDDSDLSSTSSLTESNDEDLDDVDDSFKFDSINYDDEFACEDEETNLEPVIIKRARTARQSLGLDEQCDPNTSNTVEEDKPCGRCDKSNDPEWILLCDMCDDGYHTSCCLPPLMIIPDGDWFCPSCEHKTLLTNLKDLRVTVKEVLESKERERKKNQRLRQATLKKEQVKSEAQEALSQRRKTDFIHELNEPWALQALDEELGDSSENESDESFQERPRKRQRKVSKVKRTSRKSKYEEDTAFRTNTRRPRKTYSRRNVSESDESDNKSPEHLSSSSDEIAPKARRARASVSYRFKEYDEMIKSAIHGDSYDEEDSRPDSVPDCSNYGRGKDMATIEAIAYKQENGITEETAPSVEEAEEVISKPRSKKKSRRLNDLDAASESENTTSDESFQATSATEAEDEEDDDLTEADISEDANTSVDELVDVSRYKSSKKKKRKKKNSSTYDSDGSDYQPTRTRRAAAAKQVSYKESTDDDDAELLTAKKSKKDVLSSDNESQVSWKSKASLIDDDRSTSCAESPELKIDESEKNEDNPSPKPLDDEQDIKPLKTELDFAAKPDETKATPIKIYPMKQAETKPVTSSNDTSTVEIALPVQKLATSASRMSGQVEIKKIEIAGLPRVEPKVNEGKTRDPIQELNQYCSESANSASMFNSYNETIMSKSSPIHPAFYEEDELKSTPIVEKPKRAKKPKATVRPLEMDSCEKTCEIPVPERRAPPILPSPVLDRASIPIRPQMNSSPRHQVRYIATDITTTSPRFQNPQAQLPPQVYSMHPTSMTYPRNIYPNKYAQQHPSPHPPPPPQNQVHHYPHAYDSHLNNFIQHSPRSTVPINPYANTHIQSGMWNPNSVPSPGTSSRQPVPSVYYTPNGPLPNPNFSIHQLLGNPYSMSGLAPQPNVSTLNPPPHTIQNSQSSSISQQQTSTSTQSSINSDSSTSDNRLNSDKDMIRGMSDVISFIGDT